jgi:hypothetical protein
MSNKSLIKTSLPVNVALPLLVESTADAKIKVKEKENNNKKV